MRPALSSTFGETRSTAFHAGIDLKTWGKTGYAVHAAGDGWIERARTSPWGFGRVIYLRLEDGRIAVYAHLDSFFAPVQDRIAAEQKKAGRYSVQVWFEKGEIPVRRGEVIAATGQTGAGPPHLHFELRGADNVPMNALLNGFDVADTEAPTIRRLLVVPRGPGSLADGGHDPVPVSVRWQASTQRFEAARPVKVFGRIGIGVESFDTADAADNKMAPLRHALRVEGEEVFSSRLHRVPIADWHQVALDRWRLDGHVYSNLFLRPGNRLPFYESDGSAGWLLAGGESLPPGSRRVEALVSDVAGNQSVATMTLEVATSFAEALTGGDADAARGAGGVRLDAHERFAVVRVAGEGARLLLGNAELHADTLTGGVVGRILYDHLAESGEPVVLHVQRPGAADTALSLTTARIRPGVAQRLDYHAGQIALHLDAGSAYEEIVPQVFAERPVASPGIRSTDRGFRIEPQTVSFDRWARVSFAAPEGRPTAKLGVYVSDGDGGWVHVGNDVEATDGTDARISARIRAFGTFALMEDVTPPTISALSPRSQTWVEDRRPTLRARVVDRGSGIGDEMDLSIEMNGRRLITVYDPEADMVEARPDQPLPDGEYLWSVRARDQAGNEIVVEAIFGIR